jgi:hypothetical protein
MADVITRIDDELVNAWAALQGARAAAWRSPNADNLAAEDKAEARVNTLLDRRLAAQ